MTTRMAVCLALSVVGCVAAEGDGDPSGPGGKGDIWGTDDRIERYEIQTTALQEAATRSAAIVELSSLTHDAVRNTYSLGLTPLRRTQSLCDGERFADQPASAMCSATLIGDDLMVSAGHCFDARPCDQIAIVFDFAYEQRELLPEVAARDLPAANVYRCVETLAAELHYDDMDRSRDVDYAVFRLERKVTDRAPAKVNWQDPIVAGQPAYVIGHPMGIPQKLATGKVTDTSNSAFVIHDADVFGGNSGGGLFDRNGTMIGIHVNSSGQRYIPGPTGTCSVAAVCGENADCPNPPHAYDPRAMQLRLPSAVRARLGLDIPPRDRPTPDDQRSLSAEGNLAPR